MGNNPNNNQVPEGVPSGSHPGQVSNSDVTELRLAPNPFKPIYSCKEAHQISNALKLASKIFEPKERNNLSVRQNVDLPFMPHAVDVAIQLIGAGAPPASVVAGLLHDSLSGYVKGTRESLAQNIDRKFNALSGANITGLLDTVAKPDRSSADVWLERKKKIVGMILDATRPEQIRPSAYSQEDINVMTKAVWSAHNLFLSAKPRPWGPKEQLSMFRHAAEVGLLLACSGQPRDVVVAGFMHDFYEGYVTDPPKERIEQHVISEFGQNVHEIIVAGTEPAKAPTQENWWDRKLAVLHALKGKDWRANTVVCAAKVSTIAEGNKFLWDESDITDWSSGTWSDNLKVFEYLRNLFLEKGVCPMLLERYDLELKRWRSHEPSKKIAL